MMIRKHLDLNIAEALSKMPRDQLAIALQIAAELIVVAISERATPSAGTSPEQIETARHALFNETMVQVIHLAADVEAGTRAADGDTAPSPEAEQRAATDAAAAIAKARKLH